MAHFHQHLENTHLNIFYGKMLLEVFKLKMHLISTQTKSLSKNNGSMNFMIVSVMKTIFGSWFETIFVNAWKLCNKCK